MKAVLILMRIILTPLTKSTLTLFQASAAMSAADKAILKKNSWIRYNSINNVKLRNGRRNKNN